MRWRIALIAAAVVGLLGLLLLRLPDYVGPMPRNASSTPDDLGMNQVATRTPSPSASPNATPTATRGPAASHTPSRTAVALKVRVSGNHLVNGAGSTVRLLGANRSGTQYACLEGSGIFDGPSDSASIATMKAWGMTAVRVSLNEDCWLGINGVPAAYSGANYQAAIGGFVDRLNAAGLYVILDLHSNAPGTAKALDQKPMADRDHSPAFWAGVAGHFKDRPAVVFDLYNEPYPDSNHNTTAAWTCIRDGGTCPGVPFTAAGSQEMVNAIRGAGATNVVLVGGPQYAGVVDRWTEFKPADPAGQLAASIHIYYNNPADPEWAPCYLQSCWDGTIAPLSATTPVVIGEVGEHDCDSALMMPLLRWADTKGVSYLAWSWFTGNCAGEPALISSYDGTPSGEGAGVRDHLLGLPK